MGKNKHGRDKRDQKGSTPFVGGAAANLQNRDRGADAPPPPPLPPADDTSEKTVALNTQSPFAKPPAAPPPPAAAEVDSEKTMAVGVQSPFQKAQAAPAKPAAAASPSDADSEKTVAVGVQSPFQKPQAAPPAEPPKAAAADADSEKTMAVNVQSPFAKAQAAAPAKAPAAPAKAAADEDTSEKTVAVLAGAKPATAAAKPAAGAKPAAASQDGDEKTIAVHQAGKGAARQAETTAHTGQTGQTSPPTYKEAPTSAPSIFTTPSSSSTGSTGDAPVEPGAMPEAGQRMNQYEIIRLLGEGGMGSVFLARDTKLGRRVAIKVLHTQDPEITQRFIVEARATARVEHENIVSIYEVGEWHGSPYMVLQFLQGQELNKLIPRGKRMPIPRVVELMTPVLRALAYAHSEGIVHRDLKPDNIFVTDAGVTKVLDFGIAKVVQGDDKTSDGEGKKLSKDDLLALGGENKEMTRHGAIMGTMPYMSPEQWGNGVSIDHTTDLWAVGVMMYKMLSGQHPLHPLQGMELMVTGFLDEPTPSLADKAPDLPREIVNIVDKTLMKDKSKRWPDALALLRALEPFQPGRFSSQRSENIEESPYAGLAAFQESDAARFFGRKREIAAMAQRLRDRPMMAVVGPSGVGKSSLVRAGLVPALKNSGENWDISVIRPGRTPLVSLANLLSQVAGTSTNIADDIKETQKLAERLAEEPGYLGTALRRQARREKKNLMLFVDQFEELYTLVADQNERLAFTACLAAAADDPTSPMRVVISVRSDFLDRCVEDQHFMSELSQGLFFITAPTRDGMRDAIVQPAEMAGYKFESEQIVDEMLDHLAQTSGALPLLQFTADRLWQERDPSKRMLTTQAYRNLGGIAGALAAHADRVLEQISGDQRALARQLLLRLVTPERTRAIVSVDELREHLGKAGDVQGLLDQLTAARLLTIQTGGGGSGATVELVHESLIHTWPQLAKWLDEGHEDAAFMEQMRNAARQWAAKGKDTGLLWRGEMVEEAKRFVRRYRGTLPDVQSDFLKAVIDLSNRAARIKKTIYIASAVVAAALLAAAAVALVVINESREDARLQAIAAKQAEEKATEAAEEAERRKEQAEKALNDARIAELAKDAAREAEQKAMKEVLEGREKLAAALVEAQQSEARAKAAAMEATEARAEAEQRAIEATEARNQATKAAGELKLALDEVEKRRKEAVAAKVEAERKLKLMTRGGIVEVLQ